MNPWIWAIGALVIAIAELHCPGCYLIWIAAGGVITALASFAFDISLTTQISIFVVSCSAACICGYFVYQQLTNPRIDKAQVNQRELTMVGTRGVVAVTIENGRGKVKLGDSVWLAEGPNLEDGSPVVVTDVRGTVVTVAPL
jgi:membrane protein implicated in regulation of membrane protease activity